MRKFEVLEDVNLTVKKGSIVIVDPLQFDLCKNALKEIKEETKKAKATKGK